MLKAAPMVPHHPPTPPTGSPQLQYSLHHTAQQHHNPAYRQYENVEGAYIHPDPQQPSFASSTPMIPEVGSQHNTTNFMTQYGGGSFSEHSPDDIGLGISFDSYGGSDADYYNSGSSYLHQTGQPNSPPTPKSTTNSENGRRTRSGRAVVQPSPPTGKARQAKLPRMRKSKAKPEKLRTPKLTAPLSVLTKDYTHIPIKDMEAWVNRSMEVRQKEVEKRHGYVTRPMNSFMLYRSAFAERTKMWCLQNNHQVVSSVSGESWPLEPPEIRERYNEYARLERINHQNAHPTYKFSPSKAAASGKKRKEEFSEEEEDEEPSDFEDPDADWGVRGRRRSHVRQSKSRDLGITKPARAMGSQDFSPILPSLDMSSWDTNNGAKVAQPTLGDTGIYNQYYQTAVHTSTNLPISSMTDMRMQKIVPQLPFSSGQSLLGLPGGQHFDLLDMHSQGGTPLPQDEQVDPMLLGYEHGTPHGLPAVLTQTSHFSNGFQTEADQDALNNYADYPSEAWQGDPTIPSMEQGAEFDKWMDENH